MPVKTSQQLTCFCARKPLLAVYGIDEKGRAYVHIKVYKQARIYGEILSYSGEHMIRCRECFRWHRVVFTPENEVTLRQSESPAVLGRGVTGV